MYTICCSFSGCFLTFSLKWALSGKREGGGTTYVENLHHSLPQALLSEETTVELSIHNDCTLPRDVCYTRISSLGSSWVPDSVQYYIEAKSKTYK